MKKRKPIRRSKPRMKRGKAYKYEKLSRVFTQLRAELTMDGQPMPIIICGTGFTRSTVVRFDGVEIPTTYRR